ncbi:hypothetical protein ACQKPE_10885 [Pseudomonas sp. NPDC089554]|uniref:hypothetical protein n=1 Tax=Pseudomonas sp. NPDC089554 TaxID=3390653 RepID=UPI003D050F65
MGRKRFIVEFFLAFLAYAACVALSSYQVAVSEEGAGKVAWALLPVPSMLLIAWVVVRQLRAVDELARRIQFDALALAFLLTALVTFSYGFLETAGFPRLSMFMVWPLMGVLWMVCTIMGTRRYR